MEIREIKHRLNGAQQTFYCRLLYRDEDVMIIRFRATEDPFLAVARTSEGYFWKSRHYLMYKMFNQYDDLVGHRFDICKDVHFGHDSIDWTDLVLDFFVDPTGTLHIEDEDELADMLANGIMTAQDGEIVARTRDVLEREFDAIIQETEALRRRIGLTAGP